MINNVMLGGIVKKVYDNVVEFDVFVPGVGEMSVSNEFSQEVVQEVKKLIDVGPTFLTVNGFVIPKGNSFRLIPTVVNFAMVGKDKEANERYLS